MSLRPAIPAECRAALAAEGSPEAALHQASCDFCARRASARTALGSMLAQRPETPSALQHPALLDSIYERAVEMAEDGPIIEWLESAPAPADGPTPSWEGCMLDSELARELVRRPASPSPEVWSGVRRSVLERAAAQVGSGRRRIRGWRGLLTGAAAASILAMISVSDGTSQEPQIVFTELSEAPDVPFAIVRYGARD